MRIGREFVSVCQAFPSVQQQGTHVAFPSLFPRPCLWHFINSWDPQPKLTHFPLLTEKVGGVLSGSGEPAGPGRRSPWCWCNSRAVGAVGRQGGDSSCPPFQNRKGPPSTLHLGHPLLCSPKVSKGEDAEVSSQASLAVLSVSVPTSNGSQRHYGSVHESRGDLNEEVDF